MSERIYWTELRAHEAVRRQDWSCGWRDSNASNRSIGVAHFPLGGRAKEVVLGDTMVVDELLGLLGAVVERKVVVMEGVQHGVDCVV